ncbi:SLC13 family permease [Neptunomonas japonica]|uniref:SLC13 family permease n=1 Tax=Neptunomonas japonica TaxID=417574 RepID=UPI0003F9EDF1|nr:SLC13 family permease [Neptunomonas japonica]
MSNSPTSQNNKNTEVQIEAKSTFWLPVKQMVSAGLFLFLAVFIGQLVPTLEIAWVSAVLLLTIYLFAFEIVDVDVAAATIMVLLGLTTLLAPLMGLEQGLVSGSNLFNGFSSNAVISIIAVMIIGAGLDKTGLMGQVANWILKVGGKTETRIIPIVSSTVGFISCFMQNVGAAALFLPVVNRISSRTGLPMSRLLMPMGFCAILGGTMTMIGSSPLILLNDLMLTSNQSLSADQQMTAWSLFSVTPVGICLVLTGILYFIIAGRFVLPANEGEGKTLSTMAYFRETYGLDYELIEVLVPSDSPLVGKTLEQVERPYKVRITAAQFANGIQRMGPGGLDRNVGIEANTILAVMGASDALEMFESDYGVNKRPDLDTFSESLSAAKAGIAEVVIPPGSALIGNTAMELRLRNVYGLAMMALHRAGDTSQAGQGVRDIEFQAGDTLVCHTTWEALARLEPNRDFVVMTSNYPREELRPHKVGWALGFFVIALSMVLFSDIKLSIALLTGAMGMVLSGVLSIDEAYEAVSWKTVFLLASLIPLGMAVESTGTAAWIADQTLSLLDGVPIWGLQLAVAVLATFFTLVMSNVGATVLLVPLAVNIAIGAGADPAVFALTVALATSNSFLIPTHQVNALIMGPGGYRVADFIRAGGIMTLLFLVVLIVMMNVVF